MQFPLNLLVPVAVSSPLFNKIRKRKRTKSTITAKVDVITLVELEIKNDHLFPLSPLNPDQAKRLAIAIELQHRDLSWLVILRLLISNSNRYCRNDKSIKLHFN